MFSAARFDSKHVYPCLLQQKMGQQCCSEEHADRLAYNSTQDFEKSKLAFPPRPTYEEDTQNVRNFAPVDKPPRLHAKVIEIEEKLQPFKSSPTFAAPQGTKEASCYAINNMGLIYDKDSEWRDGLPHGKGRLIYPDGSLYSGYFVKGVPSGEGRFVSSQGWYYEGELIKEQAEGRGVFAFESLGYRYEGAWDGDLPNGKGKQTWSRGGKNATYEGQFVSGKKNGKGKYKCGDEWEYQGDFSNNEMTGSKGSIKYKNNQMYEGDFLAGQKHGFGIYHWPDGSTYQGWYTRDKKEGHGKFKTFDNKIFEGEWKNGKRQGRGVLIVGGKRYPGEWHEDQPVSSRQL